MLIHRVMVRLFCFWIVDGFAFVCYSPFYERDEGIKTSLHYNLVDFVLIVSFVYFFLMKFINNIIERNKNMQDLKISVI